MCDKWWENKTEWHRNWQDNFPKEWQEVRIDSKDGTQWHIADICTPDGLIVEFQHSFLDRSEIIERSKFYSNQEKVVIWVVHLVTKQDIKHFIGSENFFNIDNPNIGYAPFRDQMIPKQWNFYSGNLFFDIEGEIDFLYTFQKGIYGEDQFVVKIDKGNFRKVVYPKWRLKNWWWQINSEICRWTNDSTRVRNSLCKLKRIIRHDSFLSVADIEEINEEMGKRFPRD